MADKNYGPYEWKKEAFGVILQRSMLDAKDTLRHFQLLHLSRKDAKRIMRYMTQMADAKGVKV